MPAAAVTDWQALPEALTIPDAARILGIGRNLAYEQAHAGAIPAVKCGGRWIVPKAQLMRLLGVDPSPAPAPPVLPPPATRPQLRTKPPVRLVPGNARLTPTRKEPRRR